MCGRYSLTSPVEAMRRLFDVDQSPNLAPRYNIAPTQQVPVVRGGGADGHGTRQLTAMHWGLIPAWAKDRKMASRLINARAESVAEKPSFRAAFKARRCLIPADGYYEWKAMAEGKQPYRLSPVDGGVMAFAGLWESWQDRAEDAPGIVESCTIITTDANAAVRPVHHRMPAILAPEAWQAWLGEEQADKSALLALVQIPSALALTATVVSKRVNNPRNDDAACIEPAN